MKILVVLVVVLGLACSFLSCASDIVLDPPPSLVGSYTGWYIYTNQATGVQKTQTITWLFTDQTYNMQVDFDNEGLTDFCICETFGKYSLEDRVRLDQNGSGPPGGTLCDACNDAAVSPVGLFLLDRTTDTLKLVQVESGIRKDIKLLRVPDVVTK